MTTTAIETPQRLRCTATKANGEQCKAWAVRDQDQCAGHLGLGISQNPQAYGRKGQQASLTTRQARATNRKLGLTDALGELLNAEGERIARQWVDAGYAGDWRAFESAATRVYGRPRELAVIDPLVDPLGVREMTSDQRMALRARLLTDHPELEQLAVQALAARATTPGQ